jgi:hypothetical protein
VPLVGASHTRSFFVITGGSRGSKSGIECLDLVMILEDHRGTRRLLSSKFELGADASQGSRTTRPPRFSRHPLEGEYRNPESERRLCCSQTLKPALT